MLKSLKVRDYAVVESVDVEFAPGLNVLTGETGAGKSVLMGALGLALGARADASIVRDGAKEAEVEADFGDKVLRRTLTREGRSRAWINDESVSIAELREAGCELVEAHGPSAAMRLADERGRRDVLDAFGGIGASSPDARAYAAKWAEYTACKGRLDELLATGAADPDAMDLLRYQVGELEAAELCDDDETLAERHAAAAHAEEIAENRGARRRRERGVHPRGGASETQRDGAAFPAGDDVAGGDGGHRRSDPGAFEDRGGRRRGYCGRRGGSGGA